MVGRISFVDWTVSIGNGIRGITDIGIESVGRIAFWRLEAQFSLGSEIEAFYRGILWWPGIEPCPDIAAGLKKQRFFQGQGAFIVQIEGKPGRFHLIAEILRGVAAEWNGPEEISGAVCPSAMIPGANHQKVQVRRIVLFKIGVGGQGTVKVFLVPPTGYIEVRHGCLMQRVSNGLASPEIVVGRVLDKTVP